MHPKYIFIDWYKTLSHSLFWDKFEAASEVLFAQNGHLIGPWMRGEYTAEQICNILSKNNLDENRLFEELKSSCEQMQFSSPEIPRLLKKLRKKNIKLVVATDNMDTFRRFTIPGMQLEGLFDDFLVSWELGALKKDIENEKLLFFDNFMKQKNLAYSEVLLLDDSVDKTGIYKKLGFEIVEITDKQKLVDILQQLAE